MHWILSSRYGTIKFFWQRIRRLFALARLFNFIHSIILAIVCLNLIGCMVGPDFRPPAAPPTSKYTHFPLPPKTAAVPSLKNSGKAQKFVFNKNIPAMWWKIFHSPALNRLIVAGLRHNPNLAAAEAALMQAQQNYIAQAGTLYPQVTANFLVEPERFSPALFGGSTTNPLGEKITSVFTLYNPNLTIAYTFDLFGALRRQIETLRAQVDYQGYQLEAAFLSLSSNIANTAINIGSLRAQIEATNRLILSQQKTLRIIQQQFEMGGAARSDVLLQQTQLEQTKATLPPLKQSLTQNYHALAILIGELPSESDLPHFNLKDIHLPAELPLSCPSQLVRQRPDIQAAEALVHVASAQIGVAIANMLPQFTINATYGGMSTVLKNVFAGQNRVWSIPMNLSEPIFSGGSLVARKRAADAAFEQAAAQYRQTVLQAFQNVADTLGAIRHDAQFLKAQQSAESAALQTYQMAQQQFQFGSVHYITVFTAERSYQLAVIARIQAEAARYSDTVALFQALGGGWQGRSPLSGEPALVKNMCQYKALW